MLAFIVTFMLANLQTPKLDGPLLHAVYLFAIAAPMLVMSLSFASIRSNQSVRGWRILEVISGGAWMVGGVGQITFTLGIGSLIAHLNSVALTIFIYSAVAASALLFIFACVYAIPYVRYNKPKEQKKEGDDVALPLQDAQS